MSLGKGAPPLGVGDRLLVLANLSPPSGPAAPGAFDFQRVAWYQQLGAVGYALAPAVVIEHGKPSGSCAAIDGLRADITERILKALPDPEGGVVAALLTGEQTAVDKDINQAMRDSGLAHILSISGLHIVFVVGLVMGLIRYGIALVPPLALRVDAKKIAAVVALLAALFYTALAGAPVPAQRSCAMAAFALLAILLDRTALSLRLVAWSAIVVLVAAPESLTGASFQMSFAAVIALIAAWEMGAGWRRRLHERAERSRHRWLWRVDGGDRREPRHDADRLDRDRRLRRLSLQPAVVARRRRQPAGRAADRLLDHAVGPAGHAADAVRAGALRPGADGLGRRRAERHRVPCRGLAAGGDAGAVAARRQPVADDDGRPVVLPLAAALAAGRPAGRRRRR